MNTSERLKQFVCWGCGNCCRGGEGVHLEAGEAERIAEYLGYSLIEFKQKFTKFGPSGSGMILKDKVDDSACVFLNSDNSCAVYPVRPQQCRDFPYEWNYPGWWRRCENTCAIGDKPITIEKLKRRRKRQGPPDPG